MTTTKELAQITGCELFGDTSLVIEGVADLVTANGNECSFLAAPKYQGTNPKYLKALKESEAGVIVVHEEMEPPKGKTVLKSKDPSGAFQKAIEHFHGKEKGLVTGFEGVHATAVIHETAQVGDGVTIGPYAVLDKGAVVGDRTCIGPHAYVGVGTVLGVDCVVHSHVVVRERVVLGDRVVVQPGAIVGSCGFGYTTSEAGVHTKLHHVGSVTVGDDAEIGANTTIDRARFGTTAIGAGTKIDNLVQIAHGVTMGSHCIMAGQSGVAGSATLGDKVVVAGQVAINGHITLADGVVLAARSAVAKSITKSGQYGGAPAQPIKEFSKNIVSYMNLSTYVGKLKDLQREVERLSAAAASRTGGTGGGGGA